MITNKFTLFFYVFLISLLFLYAGRFMYQDALHIYRLMLLSFGCMAAFIMTKWGRKVDYVVLSVHFLILSLLSSMLKGGTVIEHSLPTFLRYLLVFLVFVISYQRASQINIHKQKYIICVICLLLIAGSVYQIATDNLVVKTSTLRLSSVYGDNVTGFSLMCTVLLIVILYYYSKKRTPILLVLVCTVIFMIIMKVSRLAVLAAALYICIFYLAISRTRFLPFNLLFVVLGLSILGYLGIASGNFTRIEMVFVHGLNDASSLARVNAWFEVFNDLKKSEYIWGIGLGEFHHRYYQITGIRGMDAHNDLVKIFIESGLVRFLVYIYTVSVIIFSCLKYYTQFRAESVTVSLLAINMFFVSSLHNAYFYFGSAALALFFIGTLLGRCRSATRIPVR